MKKIYLVIIILITLCGCQEVKPVYKNVGNTYSYGDRDKKIIYLTFDDGYPYVNTKKILQILNEKKIHATFFFEGDFLVTSKSLINEIVNSGHIVANHTYSHTPITNLSNDKMVKDILKFESAYKEITNKEPIKYFRPPEGKSTDEKIKIIEDMGYSIFFWTVNYRDWDRSNDLGSAYAYKFITTNTINGDIILMHTLTDGNVLALPKIIDYFLGNGYQFESLQYLIESRSKIM